jgi:membrane-associated phospholipid phosphatase
LDVAPEFYESSASFPSGHTSIAFATATALSLKYPKWYVIAPASIWACSVGYSRMNLGVHYPSDVFAGAVLGAGSAFLTYKINEWFWEKQHHKKILVIPSFI